ncbi:MAG: nuclear transport factor 2 family protein [Psychrobium sp.]
MLSLSKATLLAGATTLMFALPASAQKASPTQQILDIENSRIDAMLNKDLTAIDNIMADNAIHITTDGSLRTKSQYLDKMRNAKGAFNHFKLRDISVRLFGKMAIATGHYENSKKVGGEVKPTKYGVFTRVYQHANGQWKMVSHQATVDTKVVIK